MRIKKKVKIGRKVFKSTIATVATIGALTWGVMTWGKKSVPVMTYQVQQVIDGDTFVTKEKQNIRLAAVDAPELENCGGVEAKAGLEKLILDKPIQLKFIYRDGYNRMISFVYTPDGLVNQAMLIQGLAFYSRPPANTPTELQDAVKDAKDKKLGIYGEKCTQLENKTDPKCPIKGNISQNNDHNKTYRFPGCGQYSSTYVQLYRGESWFCSEKEALKAGYTKGRDCLDKVWRP